ncbi:DUF3558 family protein [Saccharopolyspora taberi]|uniref:DUF3558 domain-containing protein n=1 Tax=Saccharopolyspora taberi TaxID=60895 RepID=A0ABN3VMX1_9PSEU
MNLTRSSRALTLPIGLASVLSGCAMAIPGEPIPAAGFQDSERTSAPAADVRIPQPRRTDVDPCALLAPEDLALAGGATGPPRPGNPTPRTCSHPVGGGPQDAAAAGYHVPLAEAAARQSRGVPVDIEGYSSWLYCEYIEAHQTCTATTAVRRDQTLVTLLSKQGATAADTSDQLFRLTKAALGRLPAA